MDKDPSLRPQPTLSRRQTLQTLTLAGIGLLETACGLTSKNVAPTPTAQSRPAAATADLIYQQSLDRLDQAITQNPDQIQVLGNEVIALVADFFSKELTQDINEPTKYNPRDLASGIFLLPDDDFRAKLLQVNPCRQFDLNLWEYASHPSSADAEINQDFILYKDTATKTRRQLPARFLAAVTLDLLHQTASDIRPFNAKDSNGNDITIFQRGLAFYTENPAISLPGKQCWDEYHVSFDDTVVIDSIIRRLPKLNIKLTDTHILNARTVNVVPYRTSIVPFFGTYQDILKQEQTSQGVATLAYLGRALRQRGTPVAGLSDLQRGEKFITQFFNESATLF